MPDVKVITNYPALSRQLREIGFDFERKAVRSGVAAAAAIFAKLARQNAPILQTPSKGRVAGTLKRAIYVRRSQFRQPGLERYIVSVRAGRKAASKGRDAFYWRFLEGGWMPRGPGKKIRGGKRSAALQRSRSSIRKISYPFLAPAARSGFEQASQALFDRIAKSIDRYNRQQTPK